MIAKTRYIKDTKNLVGQLPTKRYVDPKYVFLATANARCPKADVFVKEGEHVNVGQVIQDDKGQSRRAGSDKYYDQIHALHHGTETLYHVPCHGN